MVLTNPKAFRLGKGKGNRWDRQMPVPPVVGDPKKKETINESNYTHMRKNLPKQHR